MADTVPPARQRKANTTPDAPELVTVKKPASPKQKVKKEDSYNPIVDIFRVLTFLIVASCGLSYLISCGETWTWGMKNPPKYLQKGWWESHLRGPLYLTPAELAAYDGTDESKPIYLAINGTIYDVSAGRRMYGPGGGYHTLAGVDAGRAYVTGCFAEDRTPDLRGVEEMFLPLDDPATDKYWTAEQLRELRKQERAEAKQKVYEAWKHWVDFFANSKKYHKVGYVKMEEGWKKKTPRRKLCDAAQQGRSKRTIPGQE